MVSSDVHYEIYFLPLFLFPLPMIYRCLSFIKSLHRETENGNSMFMGEYFLEE
jgi:hypothetical protein